jgi:adenine phosphoribosyltransferase
MAKPKSINPSFFLFLYSICIPSAIGGATMSMYNRKPGFDISVSIQDKIRTIPDFPKKGVMFKDITPLLQDPQACHHVIGKFAEFCRAKDVDAVACAESRGFIFGAMLAYELNVAFVPLRKPGKLPYKTIRQEFDTEYSKDAFEVHVDAIRKGQNVLIVDDLLATGGTARAAAELVERLGGKVAGFAFVIELSFLNGREKLKDYDVYTLINYDKEE